MVTPRYLLDTDVLSEPLRPAPAPKLLEALRRHPGRLATASIVWHELLFGSFRLPDGPKRRAIQRYLAEVVAPTLPILPYDERAAAWHAGERARLTAEGLTPPFADGQIASIACVNHLVLVTGNAKDYARFRGISVESWRA